MSAQQVVHWSCPEICVKQPLPSFVADDHIGRFCDVKDLCEWIEIGPYIGSEISGKNLKENRPDLSPGEILQLIII